MYQSLLHVLGRPTTASGACRSHGRGLRPSLRPSLELLRPPGIWNGTDVENYTIDGTGIGGITPLTLYNFSYSIRDSSYALENPETLELENRWLEPTAYYDNCAPNALETGAGMACELHYPEVIVHCQPSCITDCINTPEGVTANISGVVTTIANLVLYNLSNVTNNSWSMENITVAAYNEYKLQAAMAANVTGPYDLENCRFENATNCHQTCVETCVDFCDNYTIPVICNSTGQNPDWQPVNFDNFGWAIMTLFTCIIAVGWTDIQYKFQDAFHWVLALYFSLVMVVGMWVILNMAIAVLADAYNDQDSEKEEAEKQRCVLPYTLTQTRTRTRTRTRTPTQAHRRARREACLRARGQGGGRGA